MDCTTKYCRCSRRRHSEDSFMDEDFQERRKWPMWKMILVWSLVALVSILLLVFILIFICFPIVFWLTYVLQRFMVFIPINAPKNPNFNNPQSYGIDGVYNFYITVADYYNSQKMASIGAWLILPEGANNAGNSNVIDIIRNTDHDILFYLHGVAENRAKPIHQYSVLRKFFLVIAIDHRGYGDSGQNVELSENAVVNDHLQIYSWLRTINDKKDVYYWGHSLGTGISCHTLRELKESMDVVPKGLVLESPFTTIAEEIQHLFGKVFGWLAYFNATMVTPVDNNGIHFYSTSNILKIDCPIMILHAEDDGVIPYSLGKKLAYVAETERNLNTQGNVTFHGFPASKGYGHNDILKDPEVPSYIEEFINITKNFHPAH